MPDQDDQDRDPGLLLRAAAAISRRITYRLSFILPKERDPSRPMGARACVKPENRGRDGSGGN